MHFLADYGLFFAKTFTLVIAILILIAGIIALIAKNKFTSKVKLEIKKLNHKYEQMTEAINEAVLSKKDFKKYKKALNQKNSNKAVSPETDLTSQKKRLYILNFNGDIRASAVEHLREEITAVLNIATPRDEIVLRLESAGGMVHSYGLAASQLQRIKDKKIPLVIIIDKVAASGGYLMACVADKIIAAPFAIIGSIGVIAQLPNFHRLLKEKHIDFEQITAGKYKRTLTLFGENTEGSREKMKESLEEVHYYFKEFISVHRPQIDIEQVATGEHWLAAKAFQFNLIDKLQTSDDYLFSQHKTAEIFEITYIQKKSIKEKLLGVVEERAGIAQALGVEYR